MSNANIEPTPIAAAMAKIRERGEEAKRRLAADPGLGEEIAKRIAEAESEKGRFERSRREADYAKSGIPRRLFGVLENPGATEAVEAVRAWHAGSKTFLLLGGGVGVGKTVGAAFAVSLFPSAVLVAGHEGLYREARPGLFLKAREVATLSQFDEAGWQRLYRTPCLAIDDLGAEALDEKGWALSAILGLLDRRYDDAARTVITTNLGVEAFRKRYGQDGGRLFDRLREAAEWVELGGESLRRPTP